MKKKVLVITALAGFIRSFLGNDIEILQSLGYEVHCAANKRHPGSEEIENYFDKKGVIFHQIDFSSNKPVSKESIIAWRQTKKLINQYDFEMVHCHTPIAGAICRWCCKKKRKKGMKVLYTTHGFYFHKGSSKKSWIFFRTIEDFMSKYTDTIITINQEDFRNAKKMHCKDIRYINGVGVDTKRFKNININREEYRKSLGINKDELMVLAIGELSARKNHQVIIKAIGQLEHNHIVFVICGNAITDDNTTDLLKNLSVQYGVNIKLLGLRKDIPEICCCADIGVLPSTREGLCIAGIEMLSAGLPVVASNVRGIVDYIEDGKNGYLCTPYDEKQFAEAIRRLISKEKRDMMEHSYIDIAERFDRTISYKQMEIIYGEVLR